MLSGPSPLCSLISIFLPFPHSELNLWSFVLSLYHWCSSLSCFLPLTPSLAFSSIFFSLFLDSIQLWPVIQSYRYLPILPPTSLNLGFQFLFFYISPSLLGPLMWWGGRGLPCNFMALFGVRGMVRGEGVGSFSPAYELPLLSKSCIQSQLEARRSEWGTCGKYNIKGIKFISCPIPKAFEELAPSSLPSLSGPKRERVALGVCPDAAELGSPNTPIHLTPVDHSFGWTGCPSA